MGLAKFRTKLIVTLVAMISASITASVAAPMSFEYVETTYPETRDLYASGEITAETPSSFMKFIQARKPKPGTIVFLQSLGGSVAGGIGLGRAIRALGYETYVGNKERAPAYCYSSCTLAFLGGVRRGIAAQARFGVYRLSTTQPLSASDALAVGQLSIGQIVAYVTEMDVSPLFATEITKTDSASITVLSRTVLTRWGVTSSSETSWEIKALDGRFYLLSTTEASNGSHKLMFVCVPNEDLMGVILYNVRSEDAEGITMTTAFYEIGIDKEDVSLDQDIVQPALPTKPERYYVNAKVRFRSQILDRIMKASTLSVRMLAWSKQTYHGWDVDLTNGRDKLRVISPAATEGDLPHSAASKVRVLRLQPCPRASALVPRADARLSGGPMTVILGQGLSFSPQTDKIAATS